MAIAVGVMAQNLYFGSFTSASSPAMEALRQGQGIIDVVNTYIGVGLQTGVVGLALAVGVLLITYIPWLTTALPLATFTATSSPPPSDHVSNRW